MYFFHNLETNYTHLRKVILEHFSSFDQKEQEVFFTWIMMSKQMPAPISEGSPYMPVITYTMACPMVMIIPNTKQTEEKKMFSLQSCRDRDFCFTVCTIFIAEERKKPIKGSAHLKITVE